MNNQVKRIVSFTLNKQLLIGKMRSIAEYIEIFKNRISLLTA